MSDSNTPPLASPRSDVFQGLDPAVRARTKKMLMYFIVFAVVMLFAAFTSAYIVSHTGQYWVRVQPPTALMVSNVLIVLSSVSLWWSLRSMRAGQGGLAQVALLLTLALGIGFTLSQRAGWSQLSDLGMGYTVTEMEGGLKAYKWNNLDAMRQGPGVYGRDYEIEWNERPLLFEPEKRDFFLPDDTGYLEPITLEVSRTNNSGGGYLWVLILVHIVHLVLGLAYLVINFIRMRTGAIHPGDVVRLQSLSIYWHALGLLWLYLYGFLFLA